MWVSLELEAAAEIVIVIGWPYGNCVLVLMWLLLMYKSGYIALLNSLHGNGCTPLYVYTTIRAYTVVLK